jgi:hypothetical protein
MRGLRLLPPAALLLAVGTMGALAQSQPITSPQDAQCRNEARDRVFGAPNPRGLSLYALGTELYYACMKRLGGDPAKAHRRR